MDEIVFNKIIKAFENVGLSVECEDINCLIENDINLQDYISDSLTFISVIISLEEEFEIEFPDGISYYEYMNSLKSLIKLIKEIISDSNQD